MSGSVMPAQKRRRQHDQRGDAGAGDVEEHVAGVGARQAAASALHQARSVEVVYRQRGERGEAHHHLHPAEQPRRLGGRIDALAHQPGRRAPGRG